MLRVLLKARLQGLFSTMFGRFGKRRDGQKPRSPIGKLGMGALMVFIVASMCFSFGSTFYMMAEPLHAAGLAWLYFAMAGLMAVALCFIGSIFITQSQLFASNDNEMLLSMPIRPSYILASRILTLLALNYIYVVIIMAPALGAYILACGAGGYILPCVLATLLLPLVAMTLTCILGWIIAFVSSRLKKNALITNLLFVGGFVIYFSFAFQLQKYMQQLINNGADIAAAIRGAFPPIYYFGSAAAGESWLNLLWLALMCIIPFAVVYALLARFFISIVTTNKGSVRIKYKERAMKASGMMAALVRKEAVRFFGTPIYLLNCGMGAVLHLLLAGVIVVKGANFLGSLMGLPIDLTEIMPGLLCVCLGFCSMTVATSAPSISLEGKGFWILKSAPVSARQALNAKLLFNLLIGLPTGLIASIAAVLVVPMDLMSKVIVIVLPILALLFTALLGLVCNLMFPRFDWISEAMVVKQSMSVMITVLGGMGIVMGSFILYVFIADKISVALYTLLITAALAVASAGMLAFLRTKGERIYDSL